MPARLFGTDGVRGRANIDLTADLALALGRSAGRVLASSSTNRPQVVIGADTRASSPMLAAATAAGFCSVGVDVLDLGVIPTPAIAYLTRERGAAGGVVVSASHNPAADNGIKFFGPDGFKLPDEIEDEIEAGLAGGEKASDLAESAVGGITRSPVTGALYEGHLVSAVGEGALSGLTVILDCANGAASSSAPNAYAAAGASVSLINASPDGVNINDGCGSTHPESLQEAVVESGADLGLAFDGDADRVIAVDSGGMLVDGDQILVMCALWLRDQGLLAGDAVVATVMSNLGLHLALREGGIRVFEAAVGDKYVIEAMRREGVVLGGEQSGHVIFADHATTGDGLLTGLQVMHVMAHTERSLADLAAQMTRLPQVLMNVPVRDKSALEGADEIWDAARAAEAEFGEAGRVLIRPSGTENVVRVMVEASGEGAASRVAEDLADLVRRSLN